MVAPLICDHCGRPIGSSPDAGFFWLVDDVRASKPRVISYKLTHKGSCDPKYNLWETLEQLVRVERIDELLASYIWSDEATKVIWSTHDALRERNAALN